MGILKTTLNVSSTDLFPTPVNFTKNNNNSIVLGSSSFATLTLAAGSNFLATVPASNAFLYVSAAATNSGPIEISLPEAGGGGTAGAVLAINQASIAQSPNTNFGQYYGFSGAIAYAYINNANYNANYGQTGLEPIFRLDQGSLVAGGGGTAGDNTLYGPLSPYIVSGPGLGQGNGASVYVQVVGGTATAVILEDSGALYGVGDVLGITATSIGGTISDPDTTIAVEMIGIGQYYNVSTFNGKVGPIFPSGGGAGSVVNGVIYIQADNYNYSGTGSHVPAAFYSYDTSIGTGFKPGDTFVIPGTGIGASSPGDDVTVYVDKINFGNRIVVAPSAITTTGGGTGMGLIVNVGDKRVSPYVYRWKVIGIEVDPANPGSGYSAGQAFTISGTALGSDASGPGGVPLGVSGTIASVSSAIPGAVPTFATLQPGDVGFFPIGDSTGYTLSATPTTAGDSLQYYVGTR